MPHRLPGFYKFFLAVIWPVTFVFYWGAILLSPLAAAVGLNANMARGDGDDTENSVPDEWLREPASHEETLTCYNEIGSTRGWSDFIKLLDDEECEFRNFDSGFLPWNSCLKSW